MTFSIVARCPRSGEYGVGIATYSPNVGVRCPVVVPQRGACSVQAVANPWLLPMARRLIESALSAEKIVAELLAAVKAEGFKFHGRVGMVEKIAPAILCGFCRPAQLFLP